MTQPLYVMGDIHGEIAMLDTALDRIAADGGAAPAARVAAFGGFELDHIRSLICH